jgi:hypothetical protein
MRAWRWCIGEVCHAIARGEKSRRNLSIGYAKRIVEYGEGEVGRHDVLNVWNSRGLQRTCSRMNLVKELRAPLSAEYDGDRRIAEWLGV